MFGFIMANILILGAGGIGLPIASALKHEEYNLVLSDYSEEAIVKPRSISSTGSLIQNALLTFMLVMPRIIWIRIN